MDMKVLMRRAMRRALARARTFPGMHRVLKLPSVKRALGGTTLYQPWQQNWLTAIKNYPDWTGIIARDPARWAAARAAAQGGPRVLIPVTPGAYSFESLLAVALTLRGAEVHFLLCDAFMPGCYIQQLREFPDPGVFAKDGPTRTMCGDCFGPGSRMLQPLGLRTHLQSQVVPEEESRWAREVAERLPVEEIGGYVVDGVAVGEQAQANAYRYYTSTNLKDEEHGEAILRRYFHAALLAMRAGQRLMRDYEFTCVPLHHGVYVPHGVYTQVARAEGVRVAAWSASYRKQSFIFSHGNTYHHTMPAEPVEVWDHGPWTPEMEQEIVHYLESRWRGARDWISFQEHKPADVAEIAAELGVDFSKPCIGLLTNVMWDAQVYYQGNAFVDMRDWVLRTIEYFAGRPDLQLIIRVHPADRRSRQRVVDEIARAFPSLPPNVFVIPPEQGINTYAVMMQCDTVLIYATKTGIEMTGMGIPVVVAGEAWSRNKGFTMDAASPEEYFAILDRLPVGERLSEAVTRRARKYAYHFFLRRMIPLPYVRPSWPLLRVEVSSLAELMPGRSVGLDVICNGILKGEPFIYPAERVVEEFDDRSIAGASPDGQADAAPIVHPDARSLSVA
jgi:hypothetical protein